MKNENRQIQSSISRYKRFLEGGDNYKEMDETEVGEGDLEEIMVTKKGEVTSKLLGFRMVLGLLVGVIEGGFDVTFLDV